jgi:putative inner membrane exporter YdcZ
VQLFFSLCVLLAARGGIGGLHHVFRTPVWMWTIIDRFGLFGVEQIAISPARLAGIVLLGIGAGLSLVR